MRTTLRGRLLGLTGTVGLMLGVATLGATIHQARVTRADHESGELARVRAVAATLAPRLDGDRHEAWARRLPRRDAVTAWELADPSLLALRAPLVDALRANGITTPIYTLRLRDDRRAQVLAEPDRVHTDAMEFVLTTSETPYWRHTYQYKPEMGATLFRGEAAVVPAYEDVNGTWISAYAPVRSADGTVTALLEVDGRLDDLLAAVRAQTIRRVGALVFGYLAVLVAVGVLVGRMTRSLTALSDAARRLGAGDLESPVPVPSTAVRELAMLATTLEASRQRLRDLVAELREKQERLAEAVGVANAATRAKSDFLASMSHELRTPMNAILGFSEMILDELDADETSLRADVEKIRSAGTHLLALINDVLDVAKVEAGRMEPVFGPVAVAELVTEVASTVGPAVRKNGNELRIDLDPDLGLVRTDAARVRQILLNVLANAAKFTERGRIELRACRGSVEGLERLRIEVRDTGIGMSSAALARVFEPFVQADPAIAAKYGGTGLGLALSRQFARLLGGDLTAESESGRGSTFTLWLPLAGVPDARATPLGQDRLLVVDDDPVVPALVGRLLSRDGWSPVVARTGREGLELARTERPRAILLDLELPDTDGWSVLTALKSDPATAQVPVVIVSGLDDREAGFALGAVDYLVKPVGGAELRAALASLRGDDRGPVLVVDDDETDRSLLVRTLEREGFPVEEASGGREALERVGRDPLPRAMLLDLTMPEVDGFDVLLALRQDPARRALPVVVVTARDLTAAEIEHLSRSADRVLRKPGLTREELLAETRRLLAAGRRPTRRRTPEEALHARTG